MGTIGAQSVAAQMRIYVDAIGASLLCMYDAVPHHVNFDLRERVTPFRLAIGVVRSKRLIFDYEIRFVKVGGISRSNQRMANEALNSMQNYISKKVHKRGINLTERQRCHEILHSTPKLDYIFFTLVLQLLDRCCR